MRLPRFVIPALVIAGVALIGADIGHGAIALLSRWGFAPIAPYTHAGVVPVLFAGLVFITAAALFIFGDALAQATGLDGDWLTASVRIIARVSWSRIMPAIFVLQIAALFVMERAEQTIALGHPLGVAAALGGPLALTLIVQALSALAVGLVTMLAARGVVSAIVTIAQSIRPAFQRRLRFAGPRACALLRTQNDGAFVRVPDPLAYRIANRPPPLTATAD